MEAFYKLIKERERIITNEVVKTQTNLLAIPFHPWLTSDHLLRLPATTPRRQGPLAPSYPEYHRNLDKLPPYALSYHHQEGKKKKSIINKHLLPTTPTSFQSAPSLPFHQSTNEYSLPCPWTTCSILVLRTSIFQNIRLLQFAIVFSCHFFLASIRPFSSLHCSGGVQHLLSNISNLPHHNTSCNIQHIERGLVQLPLLYFIHILVLGWAECWHDTYSYNHQLDARWRGDMNVMHLPVGIPNQAFYHSFLHQTRLDHSHQSAYSSSSTSRPTSTCHR